MNAITKTLLATDHKIMATLIHSYDAQAEIYLFGPGTKRSGLPVDIYIHSQNQNTEQITQIKHKLVDTYQLNVDIVSTFRDENDVMTVIGEKI